MRKQFQTKKGKVPIIQFFANTGDTGAIRNPEMEESKLCILRLPCGNVVQQWVRACNIVPVPKKKGTAA